MDVETPRGRHTEMNVLVEMSGDQEGDEWGSGRRSQTYH